MRRARILSSGTQSHLAPFSSCATELQAQCPLLLDKHPGVCQITPLVSSHTWNAVHLSLRRLGCPPFLPG